ncbi:MAG: mitochondrial small ribosomal subunit protein uS17m, partial [Candidatus Niyogibacteria bacterium]|nr:mitochondrial small ribosomal subunit protein uS17m [Candidatus Niyogibacteria bacterium]
NKVYGYKNNFFRNRNFAWRSNNRLQVLRLHFRKSKKYSAAFEGAERKVGESVVIESSRPLSKTKKWVIKNNL